LFFETAGDSRRQQETAGDMIEFDIFEKDYDVSFDLIHFYSSTGHGLQLSSY
jgi:hypothetical protein